MMDESADDMDEGRIPRNLQEFADEIGAMATRIYELLENGDYDPMDLREAILVRCLSNVLDPGTRKQIGDF